MKGYIINIEKKTKENTDYRRVLYTGKNSQLVLMNLRPHEEIGEEVHGLDQFIRVEEGEGQVVLDGVTHDIKADDAVVIPQGTRHNVFNTGSGELKLYTIYSPPEHKDGIVEKTKADEVEEHFDGKTTE
jgi:mannose-6-phosphate isomerase-like protein (cupin superfamily)